MQAAAYYTTHNTDLFLLGNLVLVALLLVVRSAVIKNRKKFRQCKHSAVTYYGGGASGTDFCTRERGHADGIHANALTQQAWIEKTIAVPVTYRYPYEHLRDDSTVSVTGVQSPEYF